MSFVGLLKNRTEQLQREAYHDEFLQSTTQKGNCETTFINYLLFCRRLNRQQTIRVQNGGLFNFAKNSKINMDEISKLQEKIEDIHKAVEPRLVCIQLKSLLDEYTKN